MKTFFVSLFSGIQKTFIYDVPLDSVRHRLIDIFQHTTAFSEPDINGRFNTPDSFRVDITTPALTYGVTYGSSLFGVLTKSGEKTTLTIDIQAAWSLRILFTAAILFGLFYLVKGFRTDELNYFWVGISFIIIGPLLALKIADMNNGVIEDRFFRYLDTAVKSLQDSA
jgi:hypothetical protein